MKVLYAYITCFILARTFALPESTLELARLLDFNHSSHESPLTEASNITDDEYLQDSCSLPWNLSRNSYQDLSDHVFRSLLQCPADLHGCSEELTTCHHPDTYVITCSCAPNCVVYGDCCWNVVEPPEMSAAELPRTSCVSVKAEVTERQVEFHPRFGAVSLYPEVSGTVFLHMVVGCPASWPRNDVRKACEEYGSFQEIFYGIPVTTDRDVTYRPVTTTPDCRAFYNGRCYIPRSADLREEDLNSRNNENNTPKTQLAEGASELWSPKNFGVANCATLACLSLSIFCLVLKIFVFCV
ncbi:hypothetical protein HPB49_025138 [Dermacentor silvarum]|uniref:Uncharacterized protein n=1 Tax=Dermacentor silvarum TaxID=543639 RepID=A0ACB8DSR0_DERSI|nr:hypothetical protein HPB49_025138 [Dermacentor silvarum]